jgi:hypothetical protein
MVHDSRSKLLNTGLNLQGTSTAFLRVNLFICTQICDYSLHIHFQ